MNLWMKLDLQTHKNVHQCHVQQKKQPKIINHRLQQKRCSEKEINKSKSSQPEVLSAEDLVDLMDDETKEFHQNMLMQITQMSEIKGEVKEEVDEMLEECVTVYWSLDKLKKLSGTNDFAKKMCKVMLEGDAKIIYNLNAHEDEQEDMQKYAETSMEELFEFSDSELEHEQEENVEEFEEEENVEEMEEEEEEEEPPQKKKNKNDEESSSKSESSDEDEDD